MGQILILGAGTAGTMMANRLRRSLPAGEWKITVVDRDDDHIYQPGLLFVPFGGVRDEELIRPRSRTLGPGIELDLSGIESVDPTFRQVRLGSGRLLRYDVLIVATGVVLAPEQTEGLTGPGWYGHEGTSADEATAFDFYSLAGARALERKLATLRSGRLVIDTVSMPIKCPVAPLEFAFLADDFFTRQGVRDQVEIVYATPLDGAFTKPRAAAALGALLAQKNILVETDFNAARVDGAARQLHGYDGRVLDYDCLVVVPQHIGAPVLREAGLGDALGFVPTHPHTLQSRARPEVFAIGDATDLPTSKAGSVAHFESEVLADNILAFLAGRPLHEGFDGHANCFIETGHGKAILIDFNYQTEPLPGRFPLPGIGPFHLLEESHVNHWGKLGFRWVYWHQLLPGLDLPIDHRMLLAGKRGGDTEAA